MNRRPTAWVLDYGRLEEDGQRSDFLWPPQTSDDPALSSVIFGFEAPQKGIGFKDNSGSTKKRSRPESCAAPGSKACREKVRRDKLNERFTELSSILEPGKPPKSDKVAILADASRLLTQLRAEADKLKKSNEALRGSIKSIKAEKSELRDEKARLKLEKERMEQMVKSIGVAAPSHAAATPAIIFQPVSKFLPHAEYAPASFWQWIPPANIDTSTDPAMWPPVA